MYASCTVHDVSDNILITSTELSHKKPDHIKEIYVLIVSTFPPVFLIFCVSFKRTSVNVLSNHENRRAQGN